ncbi:MAG: c-type cytochrome [Candidatus Rokubacteria bacterium]|nr:c-type cytochrome [Candidatus Rokubacteria bacterium]
MSRRRPLPLFWSTLLTLAAVWLILRYALPYLAMWVTGSERPLSVPGAALVMYLLLAVVGALVYITISDDSIREFVRPVLAFLRGPEPAARNARALGTVRLILLLLLPLMAGGIVYARAVPGNQSPTLLRIQHPTIPGVYERLKNPFREPTDEAVKKWMAEGKFTGSLEDARRAYQEAALAEGRVIYQISCRPCHGDAADGAGPMAWGFRLKPANFTDPGTIATVVEAYAFWRVTEGGPGLPPEGSPWDSAMPIWRQDLTDEQKWKAVMAAYDLAGVEPRKPEKIEGRFGPSAAWAQGRSPDTAENVERGKRIYVKRCEVCHGEKGDGQGPVAPYLNPRPRDLVAGSYKLRTTQSGEPPTDEDLFRVVTRGVPGTAMSGWTTLSEEDRWLVIGYIKQFSGDAFKEKGTVIKPARDVAASPESIAKGKALYQKAKCWECHGQAGRGDGPAAPTLKDDAGDFIQVGDLTKGWRMKGGRETRDLFLRFSTGLDGTPMPSYADSFSEEDRWALAHYVRSLQTREEPGGEVVLKASRTSGEIPRGPDDPRWKDAPFLAVPLAGQVLAKPRWQNHSVDAVTVRAYYNDSAIAFLLEWGDRFKDAENRPGPDPDLKASTYPVIDLRRTHAERLRDAIRLQFPVTIPTGPERPHFFLGNPGKPVALWHWQADLNETGKSAVVKGLAEGFQKPVKTQADAGQDVAARGAWKDGRWRVVMVRSLVPKDRDKDITFEVGKLIPFAIQAWDGTNGEKGLMMSLSSWNYVTLEAPTPMSAYLASLVALGLVGLLEWWGIRRVRRRVDPGASAGGRKPNRA